MHIVWTKPLQLTFSCFEMIHSVHHSWINLTYSMNDTLLVLMDNAACWLVLEPCSGLLCCIRPEISMHIGMTYWDFKSSVIPSMCHSWKYVACGGSPKTLSPNCLFSICNLWQINIFKCIRIQSTPNCTNYSLFLKGSKWHAFKNNYSQRHTDEAEQKREAECLYVPDLSRD